MSSLECAESEERRRGEDIAEEVADVELARGIEGEEPELVGTHRIGNERVVEQRSGRRGRRYRNGSFE